MFENIRYYNGITLMSSPDLEGFEYEVHWRSGYMCIGNAYISGYDTTKIF